MPSGSSLNKLQASIEEPILIFRRSLRGALCLGLAVLAMLPEVARAAPPCPSAEHRRSSGARLDDAQARIFAPRSAKEVNEALGAVFTGTGDQRKTAIARLALAGHHKAFDYLLDIKDPDGLAVYARYYVNADASACLDAHVERTLREQLRHPSFGLPLLHLLDHNLYRRQRTFRALAAIPLDAMPSRQWVAFARAVTASQRGGHEADVLRFARSLLPFDTAATAAHARVLPELHRHYVEYFVQRGYFPALAYYREVLKAASRGEPVERFQLAYAKLRAAVHEALVAMDGPGARRLLISELEDIGRRPLNDLATAELETLTAHAAGFSSPGETDALVAAYAGMLKRAQPAQLADVLRRTVYPLLGRLDTAASLELLVSELRAQLQRAPSEDRRQAVELLFSALSDADDLDAESLMEFVSGLDSPSQRRAVWTLVGRHPTDAGVSFLLQQLSFALRGGPQARELMGPGAADVLLETLTGIGGSRLQRYARDGIDSLYDQGLLDAPRYERSAEKLNAALGSRSNRYAAFLEDRAESRSRGEAQTRKAALARSRQALQQAFEVEVVRQSAPGSIAENIAALAVGGSESRSALQWLVVVGESSLPALHAALKNRRLSDAHKLSVLSAVAEIGSVTSVGPIVDLARSRPDGLLHRPALKALALLPPTPQSIAFAQDQLAFGVAPAWQAAGLVYLGDVRYLPAAARVDTFAAASKPDRVQVAALYLGARLGLPDIARRIGTALAETSDRALGAALLTALSEAAASVAEFDRLAAQGGFALGTLFERQRAYCAFRTAPGHRKVGLAYALLQDPTSGRRREAIRYLIDQDRQNLVAQITGGAGTVMPLHLLMPRSSALQLLFSEARKQGLSLEHSGRGFVLKKV